MDNNFFYFRGIVSSPVRESNRYGTRIFYQTTLSVPRLSGVVDTLPLILPSYVWEGGHAPSVGGLITVTGDLRAYPFSTYPYMRLFAFVQSIQPNDLTQAPNQVNLSGTVYKAPTFRKTPLGRSLTDFSVRSERNCAYSIIPCVAWGHMSKQVAMMDFGEPVTITGRLQSRQYRKSVDGGEPATITTYEVSCSDIAELS